MLLRVAGEGADGVEFRDVQWYVLLLCWEGVAVFDCREEVVDVDVDGFEGLVGVSIRLYISLFPLVLGRVYLHHSMVNSAPLVLHWLARTENTYRREAYKALTDNSRALSNVDKAPCMYSRCTIYRRMVYVMCV